MSETEKGSRETEVLIRRCQEGDLLATGALLRQYQDYVYRLCFLVMRNEQDAEDMTQETFIRAFRALPRFEIRENSSFEAWLYRIAVNRCRSRMRRKWYQVLPWPGSEQAIANPETQPDRLLVQSERRSEILDAINMLGEKHRLVVILHYYGGLSNEEISQALRIPSGTVRSRLHTARKRLKGLLRSPTGAGLPGAPWPDGPWPDRPVLPDQAGQDRQDRQPCGQGTRVEEQKDARMVSKRVAP